MSDSILNEKHKQQRCLENMRNRINWIMKTYYGISPIRPFESIEHEREHHLEILDTLVAEYNSLR